MTPWASGQLYVTWTATSSGTSYNVKRSVNGGAYAAVGTASLPTYLDTGLTNGTSVYCYVVDAVLNGVSSSDSTAVCATPVSNFLNVPNYSFEAPVVGLIGSFSPPQSIAYYRDYQATFTAAQATNVLALAGTSTGQANAVLIDNIRITSTGGAATQIGVAARGVAQGTGYAVLTATQTFNGTAPSGSLVFQAGGGDQVAGTCTTGSGSKTCSAMYPTANLALGASAISVTYQGDTVYAAASGSGTLTVIDANTATVQLTTTTAVTSLPGGGYQVAVMVTNNGTLTAHAATVSSLVLGGAGAAGLPATLGDIAPGGTGTVTLTMPSSAGASGSTVIERLTGTYTGDSFGSSGRLRLP